MAFDIDDIVNDALGLPREPKAPEQPSKPKFAFEDPMKELPRLGVQPQQRLPISIAPPKRLSTDMTMDEMEAGSKLAGQELRRSMMTHMPAPRTDPLSRFDRTNEELLIDLAFGGDTRATKYALEQGETMNPVTGKHNPVLDQPLETAFYGTDLIMGGGLLKGIGAYGKGVAKVAGSPEALTGALKKYSGGAIDIQPELYAKPAGKDLKKTIDDIFDNEDLPELLKPQSGDGQPFRKIKGFTKDTTDMPYYDDMLRDPEYFKRAKGIESEVVYMSPEEYLKHMNLDAMDKKSLDNFFEPEVTDKYAKKMMEGEQFPMATIHYDDGKMKTQEGRHRAIAAMKAGVDKMPVMIVSEGKELPDILKQKTGDVSTTIQASGIPEMLKPQSGLPVYDKPVITKQAGEFYEVENVQPINDSIGSLQEEARSFVRRPKQSEGTGFGIQTREAQERADLLSRQTLDSKVIPDEVNYAKKIGQEYQKAAGIEPSQLSSQLESSIGKQASVAQAFEQIPRFSDNSPQAVQKKTAIFDTYREAMPEVFEQTNAATYDELIRDAYAQAEKETDAMFKTLPVKMRFHKGKEGEYKDSNALRDDVRNNNTMNVYQGGEPHEFWSKVDEVTGLNSNEKFRAVHDYYGHSIEDNQFGRTGEERATDVHAQMYSPLARLALYAETRGQNSWVNYSNANLPMRMKQKELREAIAKAKIVDKDAVPELEKQLKDTWNDFQFAEQKAVLLPAQMVRPDFDGIMPENVRSTFVQQGLETVGTHYSNQPDIGVLSPAKYGTGVAGRERSYAEKLPDEMKPVHFYTPEGSPEAQVVAPAKSMVQTPLKGLYDLTEDPMNFRQLAKEYSNANSDEIQTNLYKQIHGAGFKGFVGDNGVAVAFGDTPVKKVASLEGMTPAEKMKVPMEPQPVDGNPAEVMQPAKVTVKPKTIRRSTTVKHMSRKEAEDLGYWHPIGDGKKLKKPVSQFQFETVHAQDEVPKRIVTPEAMLGGVILPAGGDRTNSGRLLTQVGFNKFKNPVHLDGGNGFMKDSPDGIWASKQGVVTTLMNQARPHMDAGHDAFMVYLPMKHKAANFSHMMADALYEQIVSGNVSKTARQMFDRKLRKLRKEWKGLDHPESLRQLEDNGELRHAFAKVSSLEEFQRRGFPDMGETRYAITDPDLLDTPLHHGGQAIGKMSGNVVQNPVKPHKSYDTIIGGDYVGGLDIAIPRQILFPDFHNERRRLGKPESSDYRSFDLSKPTQQATQEWLDGIMNYIEGAKK